MDLIGLTVCSAEDSNGGSLSQFNMLLKRNENENS
jgi:hypothetical protein